MPLRWVTQLWANMVRDVLDYAEAGDEIKLTVAYRPSVASRRWFTIEWKSQDGKVYVVDGQSMDIVLRRASQVEDRVETEEAQRVAYRLDNEPPPG